MLTKLAIIFVFPHTYGHLQSKYMCLKILTKLGQSQQGLDWIIGPGYSLWCSEPTKLWKPTKNHEKPYNQLEKPWKPTKNHETTLKPP